MTDKEQREKLVELLNHNVCPLDEFTGCDGCDYVEVEDCRAFAMADYLIANGVTIREHGRWREDDWGGNEVARKIAIEAFGVIGIICSECGRLQTLPKEWEGLVEGSVGVYNFCPNCGADMRGKGDSNGC